MRDEWRLATQDEADDAAAAAFRDQVDERDRQREARAADPVTEQPDSAEEAKVVVPEAIQTRCMFELDCARPYRRDVMEWCANDPEFRALSDPRAAAAIEWCEAKIAYEAVWKEYGPWSGTQHGGPPGLGDEVDAAHKRLGNAERAYRSHEPQPVDGRAAAAIRLAEARIKVGSRFGVSDGDFSAALAELDAAVAAYLPYSARALGVGENATEVSDGRSE